ncbi:methyltransferase-like protein 27 [Diadema antillarum]|uniref:methyltransferase-like protein 27 n=1 Tax=Diadema antillarum TaxID=105358 RepID=UPI003A88CDCE
MDQNMTGMIGQFIRYGRDVQPEKLTKLYDDWAEEGSYDKIHEDAGYKGPTAVARKLDTLLGDKKNARILDAGAGTGLVGEELCKSGFTNICAVDPSQKLLDVCKSKGCYTELIKSFIGPTPLLLKDDSFDAAVSSGAFLAGHCDGSSLKELVRLVKPGGLIVIAMRHTHFENPREVFDFADVMDHLKLEGAFTVDQEQIQEYSQGAMGILIVLTILPQSQ